VYGGRWEGRRGKGGVEARRGRGEEVVDGGCEVEGKGGRDGGGREECMGIVKGGGAQAGSGSPGGGGGGKGGAWVSRGFRVRRSR